MDCVSSPSDPLSIGNVESDAHLQNTKGNALIALRRYDEAAQAFANAARLDPTNAEYKNNWGNAVFYAGDLNRANSLLEEAMALDPANDTIRYNFASCLYATMPMTQWGMIGLSLLAQPQVPYYAYEREIRNAIAGWGCANPDLLGRALDAARHIREAGDLGDHKGAASMNAYETFIRQLIRHQDSLSAAAPHAEKVLIIGDSHVLSYAGTGLAWQGRDYALEPKLIMGCKAWHLAQPQRNQYKAALDNILSSASSGQVCLISVGEIDCRMNEGILSYARKSGRSVGEIVSKTVPVFVSYICETLAGRGLAPVFLTVPAPAFYDSQIDEIIKKDVIDLIAAFNNCLCDEVRQRGMSLIDLYRLTAAEDGSAKTGWHVDQSHLCPQALGAAIKNA